MNEACQLFVKKLVPIESLRLAFQEAQSDGLDNLVTVLFGYFGHAIVKNYASFTNAEKQYIFSTIESGVSSSDKKLANAVATGLLEAIYSKANKTPMLWQRIDSNLLAESRSYILAWIEATP